MFQFVVNYLGFLKFVPGLPLVFDAWLKLYIFITHAELLNWMDEISGEVQQWPGVISHPHRYGGIQFDCKHKEIGHLHSNGLLDMPLNRRLKAMLIQEGQVEDHHMLEGTGWISFYIRTEKDKQYALRLLKLGYEWRKGNGFSPIGLDEQALSGF